MDCDKTHGRLCFGHSYGVPRCGGLVRRTSTLEPWSGRTWTGMGSRIVCALDCSPAWSPASYVQCSTQLISVFLFSSVLDVVLQSAASGGRQFLVSHSAVVDWPNSCNRTSRQSPDQNTLRLGSILPFLRPCSKRTQIYLHAQRNANYFFLRTITECMCILWYRRDWDLEDLKILWIYFDLTQHLFDIYRFIQVCVWLTRKPLRYERRAQYRSTNTTVPLGTDHSLKCTHTYSIPSS